MQKENTSVLVHKATQTIIEVIERDRSNNSRLAKLSHEQLLDKAVTIGNMMAPTLYGSRLYGEPGAVSVTIRSCSEALYWLEYIKADTAEAVASVAALSKSLIAPGT